MSRKKPRNRSPATFLSREDSFLPGRTAKGPTAVDSPATPARRMGETASRRSAMTLARGNHRLPSVDESWPYPDLDDEEPADEEVDLDVLELRVDPRAYMTLDADEREALFLPFGLADGRPRSMKQIARALDVTHSRARELLGSAIEKVRTRVALEAYAPSLLSVGLAPHRSPFAAPAGRRAGSPQAPPGRAGGQLLAQHGPGVGAVGRDDQQPGVALGEELVVEPVAVEVDVGQEAAVAVPALPVEAQPDGPAQEPSAGVGGGVGAEAADRPMRVDGLGRVDTEQADPLPMAGPGDVDGVAVD